MFMHDYKYSKLPKSFHDMFRFTRSTRQPNYIVGRSRTTFSSRQPIHSFIKIWNNLDNQLKIDTSRRKFKKENKTNLLDLYN